MTHRGPLWRALASALFAGSVTLAVSVGCAPAPARAQGSVPPPAGAAATPAAGAHASAAAARPVWPHRLATIAELDFDAFPKAPLPPDLAALQRQAPPRVQWVDAQAAQGGDGSRARPLRSIRRALDRAPTGGHVLVAAGVYSQEAPVDYRALLIERSGVQLRAYGPGRVVVRPANEEQRYGLIIGGNRVTVTGLHLDGFVRAGVSLAAPTRAPIEQIVLMDLDIDFPPTGGEGVGIGCPADHRALGVPASRGLLVRNVNIRQPAILGIDCGSGPCRDWRIENTHVEMSSLRAGHSGADAFAVESGGNILLVGFSAEHVPGDGVDVKGHPVAIFNSTLRDIGRNAIKLWQGGDIVNTMLVGSGADSALVFARAGRYRMLHCTVVEHTWPGPRAYMMTVGHDAPADRIALQIRNSIFFRHSGGLFLSPGTRAHLEGNLFGEVTGGSLISVARAGRPEPEIVKPGGAVGARIRELGLGDTNGVIDASAFRDVAARDYRLAAGAGVATVRPSSPYPTMDRSGAPRSQGAGPEPGPDELP